ncbi:LysR family transcriptional regulator [Pseudomonas versuta]|uniref:LysR family transcriptional regulator n=1 Tax=Pseudomonas versuta TaxID=1788301 RepID=A0A853ZYY1_9PSED|nr:LysR family transcriptional regulator [Pseudomonas versuta]OKA29159.1 LysR family transcriptional regulator [Pseudomonas versuta]
MDSRYLKSLIMVIDCGSIADAARSEGLTAAAVSQRIQALERQLGFALLSRSGHAAMPNPACLALLPRARRIVREVSLLAGDADLDGLTGTLRIGAISTMLTGLLPRALLELTRLAPGIKPAIEPGTSRSLYQALQADELDAAILVAPPFELPKLLRSVSLHSESLVLLSRHPPAGSIARALQTQAYIRYDPSSWGGRHAERYLNDTGLAPTSLFDLDGLEAIAMLVADDVGVSLVPSWSGLDSLSDNFTLTPVGTGYDREIVLVTRVQTERPQMIAALVQALTPRIVG